MISKALIVRVQPQADRREDVATLLEGIARLAEKEPQTEMNLLLTDDSGAFTMVHLFLDDQARREHRAGPAAQAIAYSERLLEVPATIVECDVIRGPEQMSFDVRDVIDDARREPTPRDQADDDPSAAAARLRIIEPNTIPWKGATDHQ